MNNFRVGGQSPITFDRFIRGIIALVIIGGIFAMIYALSGVLIPFFVAWVAAVSCFTPWCGSCTNGCTTASWLFFSPFRSPLRRSAHLFTL